MSKLWQWLVNLALYGFLIWLLYHYTLGEWDPWMAFVVGFVLLLATVVSLIPKLHAPRVSPGEYPYDE